MLLPGFPVDSVAALNGLQEPGLVVFNNAQFTQEDIEGIQSIGDSVKKTKSEKIGQFGIGFNSMYHLTDTPYLLSADFVAVLDPMPKFCSKYSELPGARFSLTELTAPENDYSELLQPFCAHLFGLNISSGVCEGTVFKLPLRTCCEEGVSREVFSTGRVRELFRTFIDAAPQVLLFLRNVRTVEIGVLEERSDNIQPFAIVSKDIQQPPPSCGTLLTLTSSLTNQSPLSRQYILHHNTFSGDCIEVSSVMEKLLKASVTGEVRAMAFGGIAVPLPYSTLPHPGTEELLGGVSCFLPLARCKSLFNFIVNGAFELSSCRRDLLRERGPKAEWNLMILKSVVAPLVPQVLSEVVKHWPPGVPFSTLWEYLPSHDVAGEQWTPFIKSVYECISSHSNTFMVPSWKETWILLSDAIVISPTKRNNLEQSSSLSVLCEALGDTAVFAPNHVWVGFFGNSNNNTTSTTPTGAGGVTTLSSSSLRAALKKSKFVPPNAQHAGILLEMCLEDENFSELTGLPLVPLLDGRMSAFNNGERKQIICKTKLQQDVINFLEPSSVVDTESLPQKVTVVLQTRFKELNLIPFSLEHLATLLERIKGVRASPQPTTTGNNNHLSSLNLPDGFLEKFWDLPDDDTWHRFNDFHLVPVVGGKLCTPSSKPLLVEQQANMESVTTLAQVTEEHGVFFSALQGSFTTLRKNLTPFSCQSLARALLPVAQLLCSSPPQNLRSVATFFEEQLSNSDCNNVETQETLLRLPLFKLSSGGYHALSDPRFKLGPKGVDARLLPAEYICDSESGQLAERLKVLRVSLLDFYMYVVLPSFLTMDTNLREKTALKILEADFHIFKREHLTTLSQVPWVTADNNEPKRPCSLTFSSPENLAVVPSGSGFYPATQFCKAHFSSFLSSCGMSELLSPQALRKQCLTCQDANFSEALLNYLQAHSNILNTELDDALNSTAWIPCKAAPPNSPWRYIEITEPFLKPSSLILQTQKHLGFAIHPICGFSIVSEVQSHLNFKKLTTEEIISQLTKVAAQFNSMAKEQQQEHARKAEKVATSIFQKLQENPYFDHIPPISEAPIIWTGTCFAEPSRVEVEKTSGLHLEPFLYTVPHTLIKYTPVLRKLGVVDTFTLSHLIDFVNSSLGPHYQNHPLPNDVLNIVKHVLQSIFSQQDAYATSNSKVKYMLTSESMLAPIADVVYDDLKDHALILEKKLLDPIFSEDAAKVFGVTLLGEHLQSSISQGMSFGQHVDVVNVIQYMLRDTPCGPRILYEILQNADDAGASVVKIMLDCFTYSSEKLLHPSMQPFQGPALVAYNNAMFQPSDWNAIQTIASGTKESHLGKIGRYGVGFLSCFHVTDLPSILSGDTLAFFDPLCTHVPLASHSSPGRCYKLSGDRGTQCKQSYASQFEPYKTFGWDGTNLSGTVLRLPLRQGTLPDHKSVVQTFLNANTIKGYFHQFATAIETSILFLKNVRSVQISVREADSTISFLHSTTCTELQPEMRDPLLQFVGSGSFMYGGRRDCTRVVEVSQEQNESPSSCQTWVVAEAVVVDKRTQSLVQANNEKGILSSVPWVGVAIPVKSAQILTPHATPLGTVNCFLPLPETTTLPVALNALFELSTGREITQSITDSMWNKEIFSLIAETYCHLLEWFKEHTPIYDRQSLFSVIPDRTDRFHIAESVWETLKKKRIIYSLVTGTWELPSTVKNLQQEIPQSIHTFLVNDHLPFAQVPTAIACHLGIVAFDATVLAKYLSLHTFSQEDFSTPNTVAVLHDSLRFCLQALCVNFPVVTHNSITRLSSNAGLVYGTSDATILEVVNSSAASHIVDETSSDILLRQRVPQLGLLGSLTFEWVLANLEGCKGAVAGRRKWNKTQQPITWFHKLFAVLDNLNCKTLVTCQDAILPASDGFVYCPVQAQEEVIECPTFESDEVPQILDCLSFPIISVTNETYLTFLRRCKVLQPFTVKGLIHAMVKNRSHLLWVNITNEHAGYLLQYIESNLPLAPSLKTEFMKTDELGSLPLFVSAQTGQRAALRPNNSSWLIPHDFPQSLLQVCPRDFLRDAVIQPNSVSPKLFHLLGVQGTKWSELIQSLCFVLHPLPADLLSDWQTLILSHVFNLHPNVASVAFVPSDAGTVEAPANLFSPENDLFKLAFRGTDKLPHHDSYKKWKPVLDRLTLAQFTPTSAPIVAQAVVNLEDLNAKRAGCVLIMKEICCNSQMKAVFSSLVGIQFVPCQYQLPHKIPLLKPLLETKPQGIIFLSPKECVRSNWCCWTQVPQNLYDDITYSSFLPECKINDVLQHAVTLSQFALQEGHDQATLSQINSELHSVANHVHSFLQFQRYTTSGTWSVAFLVETKFIPSSKVFSQLKEEIDGFAYILPDEFISFSHFSAIIGLQSLPSISQVFNELETYRESSQFTCDDKQKISKLLSLYVQLLGKQTPNGRVLVPANEWSCMLRAQDTVYFDKESWHNVINQSLVPLCSVPVAKEVGSQPLSQSVKEVSHIHGTCANVALQEIVTSSEFCKSLCAILDHMDCSRLKEIVKQKLLELKSWEFLWVEHLDTKYLFKGSDVTIPLTYMGNAFPKSYVFDQTARKLITTNEDPGTSFLAKEFADYLTLAFSEAPYFISTMLQAKTKHHLLQTISQLGITVGVHNMARIGEPVLNSEHTFIRPCLFGISFAQGEVVTFVDEKEEWRYGEIVTSCKTDNPLLQINPHNRIPLHASLILRMCHPEYSVRQCQQPANTKEVLMCTHSLVESLSTMTFNRTCFALNRMSDVLKICRQQEPERQDVADALRLIETLYERLPSLLKSCKIHADLLRLVIGYLYKEDALALGKTCKWIYNAIFAPDSRLKTLYNSLQARPRPPVPPTYHSPTTPTYFPPMYPRRGGGCRHCPTHCP
ncbi:zinc finger protein [Pelomyxa schiedti]|nr:zinc finger protein [Pelomyxa schiedti]